MDGQPWRSKSRGGGRERSERADRERSEHATASCVRRLLRRHQFISDAVCPLCAHSLLSASRGHRHRFSSPPHPSIHPRHTIPSSTTAIQSRINTVTIKASERERKTTTLSNKYDYGGRSQEEARSGEVSSSSSSNRSGGAGLK